MSEESPLGGEDLRLRVLDALNKGGYALEMRIAAKTREIGANFANQSHFYTDLVTQKIREIDVLSHWMSESTEKESWVHLFLPVECKSKPAPWVIFDDGQVAGDPDGKNLDLTPRQLLIQKDQTIPAVQRKLKTELADYERSGKRTLLSDNRYGPGNGIVEVNLKPTTGKLNETNKAWAAVQSATSAAQGLRSDFGIREESTVGEVSGQAWLFMWIPVVVTSGILYRAWLNEDNKVDLQEIDRGSINVKVDTNTEIRCMVTTEQAYGELIADAQATVDLFA